MIFGLKQKTVFGFSGFWLFGFTITIITNTINVTLIELTLILDDYFIRVFNTKINKATI